MGLQEEILAKAKAAKKAAAQMALLSTEVKNQALRAMADALLKRQELILSENEKDLEAARQKGIKRSLLDRLLRD